MTIAGTEKEKSYWGLMILDGKADLINTGSLSTADIDLVSTACYTSTPGIFVFKRGQDIKPPWTKYAISGGFFTEGLSIGNPPEISSLGT